MVSISMSIGDRPENTLFACQHMKTLVNAAHENNVEPETLLSLIHHESRWKPDAVSHAGACGLTQIMPKWTGDDNIGTFRLTCNQLKNPRTSIKAGAKVLSYWVHKYGKGSYTVGLCGYNAGFRCKGTTPHMSGMMYAERVRNTAKRVKIKMKKIKSER